MAWTLPEASAAARAAPLVKLVMGVSSALVCTLKLRMPLFGAALTVEVCEAQMTAPLGLATPLIR